MIYFQDEFYYQNKVQLSIFSFIWQYKNIDGWNIQFEQKKHFLDELKSGYEIR